MRFFECFEEKKWAELEQKLPGLKNKYQHAAPFEHMVFDDLFNPLTLMEAEENFPRPDKHWWKYDNFMERKWAKDNLSLEQEPIRGIIQNLQDKKFVQFIESLTGIQGLIVDHMLNGAGLHQISNGGKLDLHVDSNYHPITKLDRRVNVILYLNFTWIESWGGELEFWDQDVQNCHRSIIPSFNRMVVFSTNEYSIHGHPEPLQCPDKITRKSIALYYFTNGRPTGDSVEPHSTIYKKRPQDPDDPSKEELRRKRAIKRLQ